MGAAECREEGVDMKGGVFKKLATVEKEHAISVTIEVIRLRQRLDKAERRLKYTLGWVAVQAAAIVAVALW